MAETVLVHHIPGRVEEIYPYFCDMPRFVDMHPVIYRCEPLGGNDHMLYERLRVMGIGISFSYPVSIIEAVPNVRVVMHSPIRRGADLRLVFDMVQNGHGTIVTETITFRGPFFVWPFFIRLLRRMHCKLAENIGCACGR
ncbi:hypothetical protein GCM10023093_25590 [Nemorincola caseinilytica]|uniref:SRPBCC family protein n=1 Tax=Nemorincola caseinilytica TaxID=2054315 RepID=A0ABP8NMG9_9BACT